MSLSRRVFLHSTGAALLVASATPSWSEQPKRVSLDWAYYNPLSLVLRDKGWLDEAFKSLGVEVRWVQSHGSNKALEFLNAGAIDLGSTAGAAALLGRINGNPIRSIYVYSKPEWTALVKRADSNIRGVADLKGKRVAVTRGTDPYIFLLRALAEAGLSERDIRPVLLQHADGRAALERGDVDAWAGLDPMMAESELERHSVLFHRNADLNSWGVLNVRAAFAARHPETVLVVLRQYERARRWAQENPAELKAILARAAKLSYAVAARQLERTGFAESGIGAKQHATILAAGIALQQSGVIDANVDVKAVTDALIDPAFSAQLAKKERAETDARR